MARAKPWPYKAAAARDDALMDLSIIIRELRPLVEGGHTFTRTEQLRREASALVAAQDAVLQLEKAK